MTTTTKLCYYKTNTNKLSKATHIKQTQRRKMTETRFFGLGIKAFLVVLVCFCDSLLLLNKKCFYKIKFKKVDPLPVPGGLIQ